MQVDDSVNEVESVVLLLLDEAAVVTSRALASRLGVSRQAASRHLARLVEAGVLERRGAGRATRYVRAPDGRWERSWPLAGLEEHVVWEALQRDCPGLRDLSGEARSTVAYCVTEMLNNAIDHSRGTEVVVDVVRDSDRLRVTITDDGVGAFDTVMERFALDSRIEALQELSKGKVTTMPSRHTGEGLFFTSKAASWFELTSGGVCWQVDNRRSDQAVGERSLMVGTRVHLEFDLGRVQPLQPLFDAFTEDFAFTRTRTHVRLFEYGVSFVSRSEAKRLTRGLERFSEVIVDFQGVETVGQGFADELFRVWGRAHPDVALMPTHMNQGVAFMVNRALAAP